ncbi:hypothetical protein EG329_008505 [Mollisiaceae sp. DMI_Dod_QoI]|nr:hypothetical protein EG329_008505 [Helotiales sp. DMI_Dod_QoI]
MAVEIENMEFLLGGDAGFGIFNKAARSLETYDGIALGSGDLSTENFNYDVEAALNIEDNFEVQSAKDTENPPRLDTTINEQVRLGAFGLFTQRPIGQGQKVLEVLNPVAVPKGEGLSLAPRLETLSGKRVAFFWNSKPGGDRALRRLEEQLLKRFPDMIAKQLYWKHYKGGVSVGASADLVALERLGIPTVIVTTAHFVDSVRDQAEFSGLIQPLPVAIIPDPLTNITLARVIHDIDAVIDEVVEGLVVRKPVTKPFTRTEKRKKSNLLTYRGASVWDVFDVMTKNFLERGVSDELPIIPPTQDRVNAMLANIGISPET